MKRKKSLMLLLVLAMTIMSTLTVSAHNLDCPTCGYPDSCYICRGAYYITSSGSHNLGTWWNKNMCYYDNYSHGCNIKCPYGHLTYTTIKHFAGTDHHSKGCSKTFACGGVGTVVF